ncbi:MAG: hypothetical protein WBP79_04855 [Candidatus Acidiferrales bacterium]
MRLARWGSVILLVLPVGIAAAQQQQPPPPPASQQEQPQSVGEAARRAREQKKDQAKGGRVWDNDNIPKTPSTVSVVGQGATPEGAAAPAAGDAAAAPAASDQAASGAAAPAAAAPADNADKEKTAIESELSAAKELLQSVQKDLDIASRQYSLDQQQFNTKPNYASDREGAAKLADEASQVEAKRQQVADAQKRVDELTAKLKSASAAASSPN